MKKLLLIVNPYAGKTQIKGKLTDVLDIFIKEGYRTEVYITQEAGDATELVRERGPEVDAVVCSGGDGTLHETVNGLMQLPEEERPMLGYISAGTTNDFAHSLKLPLRVRDAAKTAVSGVPFQLDIGKANEKYFNYVMGFGAFTDVSYITPQAVKNVLGHPAYIMEAAKELVNLKSCRMRVEAEEQTLEDNFLCGLVSNSYQIGGMKGLWGKDIHLDDGLFEVMLVRMPPDLIAWGVLVASISAGGECEYITRFKTSKVRFISEQPVDWVQDGEFGGAHKELEITNLPRAVTIMKKK